MGNTIDLTNKTFSNYTVIERNGKDSRGEALWKCKCNNCGNRSDVRSYQLRKISSKSCIYCKGQKMCVDLKNQKFGKLTPIKYVGSNKGNGALWLCRCDCGNETIVTANSLQQGTTKSCGCWNMEVLHQMHYNISGEEFGYIKVISHAYNSEHNGSMWNCICSNCGKELIVSRHSLMNGQLSCGCLKSKSEYIISQILNDKNIIYEREYIFNELRSDNNMPLRFDFCIKNEDDSIKALIEYQGIIHYQAINWYNGMDGLKSRQKYDNQKVEYCNNNNIPLYIIKYDENIYDKMEMILNAG